MQGQFKTGLLLAQLFINVTYISRLQWFAETLNFIERTIKYKS